MSASFVQRGGWWVVGQFALLSVVVLSALDARMDASGPLPRIGALGLLVLGGGIGIAGALALGRNLTPFPRPGECSSLVQHGIFRFVRHPLYASLILMSAGWSLLWQIPAGGIATGLLALLLDAKARREEVWLRARFPDYAGYERRVKRLVPGVY